MCTMYVEYNRERRGNDGGTQVAGHALIYTYKSTYYDRQLKSI